MSIEADARFLWGLLPPDCKSALTTLQRAGRLAEAREAIIREAEQGLRLIGQHSLLDVCAALELAAEHWLSDMETAGHAEPGKDGAR